MPNLRYSRLHLLLATLVLACTFTGCVPWARGIRSLDESVTDWRDFVWGKRAYYQRYGHDQSGPFQDGFLEGYHDMLQGEDGCLPVVPPRRYWKWKYQSAGGRSAVNDWFSGYSAGVRAAREDGLANISSIPTCSECSGNDPVPVQQVPSPEAEEIYPSGPIENHSIPIPPTIEPDSVHQGTMNYRKGQGGLVRPASARTDLSPGRHEITPGDAWKRPIGSGSSAKNAKAAGSGQPIPIIEYQTGNPGGRPGLPRVVPVTTGMDRPLPANR